MAIEGPDYFYVNCAKTASRAITAVLMEHYGGWRSCEPWQYDGDKTIVVSVRDPYERCLSLWWALTQPGDGYGVVQTVGNDPIDVLAFVFSDAWGGGEKPHPKQGCTSNLCQTCVGFLAGLSPDVVIRYESLDADVSAFIGYPVVLPVINRKPAGRPPRWPLRQPDFIDSVNYWCADDFEAFGYQMQTP